MPHLANINSDTDLSLAQKFRDLLAVKQARKVKMPEGTKLNVQDKRQIKAAELQLFVKDVGRKAQKNGLDPNDRRVDRHTTDAVRRMRPEDFDQLLRNEEDR